MYGGIITFPASDCQHLETSKARDHVQTLKISESYMNFSGLYLKSVMLFALLQQSFKL